MTRFFNLKTLMAMLIAAILIFPSPGSSFSASGTTMPSILLTLDGIQGSYSDASFKGAITVSSYSFGAPDFDSLVTGAKEANREYQDILLDKTMDDSSLSILKALAKGQKIPGGTLYFQSTQHNMTYMKIHLTGIQVTGYNVSFIGYAGSAAASESISLHADQMLFEYTTLNPDGSLGETDQLQIGQDQGQEEPPFVKTQYHFDPIYDTNSEGLSYIKGFQVSLKASANSTSVQQTQYRINGGSWVTYTDSFNIYAADTHSLEYFSTDRAGNVEETNIMNFDTGTFTGAGSY